MKTLTPVAAPLVLGLALLSSAAPFATAAEVKARHYVCPPCGLPCDGTVRDAPGTCPRCGMALVDQESVQATGHAHRKVAILVFDGVEIIDYTGPYEVFGAADFEVYTVAQTRRPVTTAMGMEVVPKYSFVSAPQPDVLVVPGGGVKGARDSAATLKWIKNVTAQAQHTMSVCNGAFILASAGLLDGLTVTTTSGNIDRLRTEYPGLRVVDNQRFVDNGKIITTGGLTSGIDGALHVVSLMRGKGRAQEVALYEEYDWRPDSGFARAALADRLIPELHIDEVGKWDLVSTEGGTARWEVVVRGTSDLSAAQLMEHIGRALATHGKWTNAGTAATPGSAAPMRSDWKFTGRDGKAWAGTVTIQAIPGEGHQYTAKLSVARGG